MKKIHYIAEYGDGPPQRELSFSPSGVTKMKYVIDSIKAGGNSVAVYSTSKTKKMRGYFKSLSVSIDENQTIKYRSTFGASGRITKRLERFYARLQLLFYILFFIKKDEVAVVFHERYYLPIIKLARKLKKFSMIYEVEEIYAIVAGWTPQKIEREISDLNITDRYIFPNQSLAEVFELTEQKYCVAHGTYKVEDDRNCKFDDGKVHVVFAGIFRSDKGAASAAKAARFLPENYHIHIIGFGSNNETKNLLNIISQVATESACTVTFDGCLLGEEYIRFLQSCHIGLSTQSPMCEFNDTSFPSKVLSYMANGLYVVSIRIRALEQSGVSDLLYYYNEDTPEAIAEAIQKVDLHVDNQARVRVAELDQEFIGKLKILIENKE